VLSGEYCATGRENFSTVSLISSNQINATLLINVDGLYMQQEIKQNFKNTARLRNNTSKENTSVLQLKKHNLTFTPQRLGDGVLVSG
jgi:hypothetical protein